MVGYRSEVQNPSKKTDIVASPSGREAISLQKEDSLLGFVVGSL
jgi:hypothetical protein